MEFENENRPVTAVRLEWAVILRTPQEAASFCKNLREGENSCRALGLACRFRGLEYVKALVENGATFRYTRPANNMVGYYTLYYWLSPLEMTRPLRRAYFTNGDAYFSDEFHGRYKVEPLKEDSEIAEVSLPVLPIEQRVEIVKYLCENAARVFLEPRELLFYSIMSNTKEITAVLKEMGTTFTPERVAVLTESGRSFEWMEFCNMLGGLGDDEFTEVVGNVVTELGGKPLHYTDMIYWENYNPYRKQYRLFDPDFFRFTVENYNQKKMNKTKLMKGAIDENSVQCLEICAELGWLRFPHKRDEMIAYASEKQKTECVAWLLDFKNRTADFAAERIKAEKKAERALNADPNSATELKKIWNYEKQEDGTLIITRYKGKRTDVEVPSMIGRSAVTAIGEWAFSPHAPRLVRDRRSFMETITKISLPDGIRSIGNNAFHGCAKITKFEIPKGVVTIGDGAFYGCGFTKLDIPDSVAEIGSSAFCGCKLTEIVVPDTVVKMGNSVFAGSPDLVSVKLPKGIEEIGAYMFSNCKSLKTVKMPSTVKKIGKCAFLRCASIERLIIPAEVTEIEQQAFKLCSSLKYVLIPPSVSKMKNQPCRVTAPESVFHGCHNLTAVVKPKSYAEKYCKRNEIKYICKEQNGT